jgi:hypothetical protein
MLFYVILKYLCHCLYIDIPGVFLRIRSMKRIIIEVDIYPLSNPRWRGPSLPKPGNSGYASALTVVHFLNLGPIPALKPIESPPLPKREPQQR